MSGAFPIFDPHAVPLKKRINRRAWTLARKVYKRYRDELMREIRDEAMPPENIESWTPSDCSNVVQLRPVPGSIK